MSGFSIIAQISMSLNQKVSFGTHCDSGRGYDYPRAFLKLISFALIDKKFKSILKNSDISPY